MKTMENLFDEEAEVKVFLKSASICCFSGFDRLSIKASNGAGNAVKISSEIIGRDPSGGIR